MILQLTGELSDFNWVIGIAMIFGLGFLINSLIDGNMQTLLLIMLAVNGVVVLAQLLEEWTLILNMIVNVALLINNATNRGGSSDG